MGKDTLNTSSLSNLREAKDKEKEKELKDKKISRHLSVIQTKVNLEELLSKPDKKNKDLRKCQSEMTIPKADQYNNKLERNVDLE